MSESKIVDVGEIPSVDPWQAAQEIVDALVTAGLLGRDPVTRAEVAVVLEAELRRLLGVP